MVWRICSRYVWHPGHAMRCSSNRTRSAGGERILQIVGHELHQLSAAELIWNAHLKSGSRSSEVLLQRSPNPRATAV